MKTTLLYLSFILILSVFGFLVYPSFFEFSLSQILKDVDTNNPMIRSKSTAVSFSKHILFAFSFGAIPLLYLFIKKVTKLKFLNQGMIASFIILCLGLTAWQLRLVLLNIRIHTLSKINVEHGTQTGMDLDELNLITYLFIGFLIGTGLSILIFSRINKALINQKK